MKKSKKMYVMYYEGWQDKYLLATPLQVWDLARELRGDNSLQEYTDPKNVLQAIDVLKNYCSIEVNEIFLA
jgi:hypothetical protein